METSTMHPLLDEIREAPERNLIKHFPTLNVNEITTYFDQLHLADEVHVILAAGANTFKAALDKDILVGDLSAYFVPLYNQTAAHTGHVGTLFKHPLMTDMFVQPENRFLRDGLSVYTTDTVVVEPPRSFPDVRSVWQHTNGNLYRVVGIGNIEAGRQDKYPTTVWYVNAANGKRYNRKLSDWHRSMTLRFPAKPDDVLFDQKIEQLAYRFVAILENIKTTPDAILGDLYMATKNKGQGTGWSFPCSGIMVSDIEEAAKVLTALREKMGARQGDQSR